MRTSLLLGALLVITQISHARVGDEWVGRRGDLTPGAKYNAATTTSSGRIVAIGGGGQLMISDDGGANWDFRKIEVNGVPERGSPTDIVNFNGTLIAVMAWLEDAPSNAPMALAARTYLLKSTDNGNTWTKTAFPYETVNGSFGIYYGVNLVGLHVSPGGKLIAYGTTTVCEFPNLQWMIGGLIYYSSDGNTWTFAKFGLGALFDMADAGGRMVTTGFTTVMDSADGAGWNGYSFTDANVQVSGGSLLPYDKLHSLFVTEVEYLNGNYVAQAARLIPREGTTNVFTGAADKLYTLVSPNPFSGGRLWTAYEQPKYYGKLFTLGSNLVAVGKGAYSSGNGQSFSLQGSLVDGTSGSVARVNASTLVAVESSTKVWKTITSGSNWSESYSGGVGPDLRVIGNVDGTIFAKANNTELWVSTDNGENWEQRATGVNGISLVASGGRLFLPKGTASTMQVSDNGGVTWGTRTVANTSSSSTNTATAYLMTKTKTGRLILAAEGKSVQNEGVFWLSDDNGQTWFSRSAHLTWDEDPTAIVCTASGRIIVSTTTFAGFNPRLVYSDDNGETWEDTYTLRTNPGLDPVSNDPSQHVIDVLKILVSPNGRLVMLGGGEILTSDDDGDTWQVRVNQDYPYTGPWLNWDLFDIAFSGQRWVVTGKYETPYPQSRIIQIALTSDDDGTTWRQTNFPARQSNTYMYTLVTGKGGRVIATGGNAAVYTTEAEAPSPASNPPISIREGTSENIMVDRPPLPGIIDATYMDVPDTALAGTDYQPVSGTLQWQANDVAPKAIPFATINNTVKNNPRRLTLQVNVKTTDFESAISLPIDIEDDDGTTYSGILFDDADALYTTEAGGQATLKIALERKPTANVQLAVSGGDATEGTLSATNFLFTPENWNVQQTLTITGVDDSLPDGDASYDLKFAITSADTAYSALPTAIISVVNTGDEPYKATRTPTAPLPTAVSPTLFVSNKFTGKASKANIKGTFSGVASKIEVKVGKGKFAPAKFAGGSFLFKAKGLPDHGKVKVVISVTFSNGQVLTKKVKIIIK